jgi:hypothetical protein
VPRIHERQIRAVKDLCLLRIGRAWRRFGSVETDPRMGAVAKRRLGGLAAAAERVFCGSVISLATQDGLARRLVALQGYTSLAAVVIKTLSRSAPDEMMKHKINLRDPQKGQWDGKPSKSGWTLSASVVEVEEDWYEVKMVVEPANESNNN